jgi:hypothetical protein
MAAFASGSTYTRERLRTAFVRWVTGRRRPMSIINDPEFLQVVKMLNPQAVVPSRITLGRDIKTMFSMTRTNVKDILQVSNNDANALAI